MGAVDWGWIVKSVGYVSFVFLGSLPAALLIAGMEKAVKWIIASCTRHGKHSKQDSGRHRRQRHAGVCRRLHRRLAAGMAAIGL